MELFNLFNELAESGVDLEEVFNTEKPTLYQKWLNNCDAAIASAFGGKHCTEAKSFRKSYDKDAKISALKALAAKMKSQIDGYKQTSVTLVNNISQNQLVSVVNEFSMNILLNIEHSELNETEKAEAKRLFNDVKSEVEKPETNWDNVKGLLKKSLDYGLKIAPDIVKLADAYYRAKLK